nr:unnamed protein product [Naegleria fowleri]
MCWSMKSSFFFSCLGLVMTLDQVRRFMQVAVPSKAQSSSSFYNFKKAALFSQILLYGTYFLMESLQFAQYYFGLIDSCHTPSNQILTVVAHLLIWGQPLAHNYWCLKNTLKGKNLYRFTLVASLLCLIVSSISLYMGYYGLMGHFPKATNFSERADERKRLIESRTTTWDAYGTESSINGVPLQNIGTSMCSYQGPNHLYWMFPYHQLYGYAPHWFTWLLITVLPHFFRYQPVDDWFMSNYIMGFGLFSGWVLSVIVSLSFGVFHEIWSYWCLESVPYLVLPYLYRIVWRGIIGGPDPKHGAANAALQKEKLQ